MMDESRQWHTLRRHKWVLVVGVCSVLAGGCSTPGPSGVMTVVNPTPVYSLPVMTGSQDDNGNRAAATAPASQVTSANPAYGSGKSVPIKPTAGKPTRGHAAAPATTVKSGQKATKIASAKKQPCQNVKAKPAAAKKASKPSAAKHGMSRAKAALPAVPGPAPQK
ncbi:MAG: hypothetical protein HQL58_04740 [Magnetococcales bacterium]|nr:hypothetical protein [Magnetococcales bacterium]